MIIFEAVMAMPVKTGPSVLCVPDCTASQIRGQLSSKEPLLKQILSQKQEVSRKK